MIKYEHSQLYLRCHHHRKLVLRLAFVDIHWYRLVIEWIFCLFRFVHRLNFDHHHHHRFHGLDFERESYSMNCDSVDYVQLINEPRFSRVEFVRNVDD